VSETLLEAVSELRSLHDRINHCREHIDFSSDDAMEYLEELAHKTADAIDHVDIAIRALAENVEDLRARFLEPKT
jgi:hypothetical protein